MQNSIIMQPSDMQLEGFALRSSEQLWYMFQCKSPSASLLPTTAPTPIDDHRFLDDRMVPWDKHRPWQPFAPKHSGLWAPFGWNWVFGPLSEADEVVEVRSGLHVSYQYVGETLERGAEITRLIEAADGCFDDPGADIRWIPPWPTVIRQRAVLSGTAARQALTSWRTQCRERLAYYAYLQAKKTGPERAFRTTDPLLREFLQFFTEVPDRRGVVFDPDGFHEREDELAWRLWLRTALPFAFSWSRAYAARAELRFLNPEFPSSNLILGNAADPGPRVYAATETAAWPQARIISTATANLYESRFRFDDISSAFEKVNYRVYLKDELLPTVDPSAPWEDPEPFIAAAAAVADDDDGDAISLGSTSTTPDDREFLDLAVLTEQFGLQPQSSEGGSTGSPTVMASGLFSPAHSSTAHEGASIPAVEELAENDDPEPLAPDWIRDLARDIEHRFEDEQLYMTKDGDIDIIHENVHIPLDSKFVENCEITYPPSTELWFLYKLAWHEGVISRPTLWYTALRGGLPFRPRFPTWLGRQLADSAHQQLLQDWPVEDLEPAWAFGPREAAIAIPSPLSNETYELQYRRTVERIRHYPHFETLLFHGGLTWRLVLELGGSAMGQKIGRRPSDAWVLRGIEAPKPLFDNWHSEVFTPPDSDGMVQALHGRFVNGVSLWPSQRVFLGSYRWRGMWTEGMESWFQTHLQDIRQHTFQPRGDSWWEKNFARPTATIRQSGRPVDADAAAQRILGDVYASSGIASISILKDRGAVYANPNWRAE